METIGFDDVASFGDSTSELGNYNRRGTATNVIRRRIVLFGTLPDGTNPGSLASQLKAAIDDRQKALAANPQTKELGDSIGAVKADLPAIVEGTSVTPGFGAINRDLARYVQMIQSGDARPASSASDSAMLLCRALADDLQRWRQINESRLPQLNQELQIHKLASLPIVRVSQQPVCSN